MPKADKLLITDHLTAIPHYYYLGGAQRLGCGRQLQSSSIRRPFVTFATLLASVDQQNRGAGGCVDRDINYRNIPDINYIFIKWKGIKAQICKYFGLLLIDEASRWIAINYSQHFSCMTWTLK